ncbi:MAG TPA: class I tRNA ligase family protein, partial [Bacillota bacterium]
LVRDAEGQKMSKSRGNVIDPLEVIERFGADALRWSLITGNAPGNDMRLHTEKFEGARNFCNKLWNAARFVLMHLDGREHLPAVEQDELALEDRWILHRLNETIARVDRLLERFEIGEAAQELYDFIWSAYCDWYIEMTKPRLAAGGETAAGALAVLVEVLETALRLLHPFMPFITEELWQHLPHCGVTIVRAPWPEVRADWRFEEEAQVVARVMDVIRALRNIRSEFKVDPARKIEVILHADAPQLRTALEQGRNALVHLAGTGKLQILERLEERPRRAATAVVPGVEAYVPLAGLIDLDAELARLQKEYDEARTYAARLAERLQNPEFLKKAPAAVIERERQRESELRDRIERLAERLSQLRDG